MCGSAKKERKEGCTMRKVSLILAVLLFAAPALARVDIICEQIGDTNEVLVRYVVTVGEPNIVRAFALDITVDNGVITEVNDDVSAWYDIYPGSISIVDGNVVDDGNAVADPCDHSDTQLGIDSNGVTVEMGALYSPPDDAHGPPLTGDLLTFFVSESCHVTITENGTRGGVVLTDPNQAPDDVNAPGCDIDVPPPGCFPSDHPDYPQWLVAGQLLGMPAGQGPECWCFPRQCHGDADGKKQGTSWTGYWYVGTDDLNVFVLAWLVKEPDKGPGIATIFGPNGELGICADFARDQQGTSWTGYWRVGTNDLNELVPYWLVKEPDKGPGVPPDCGGTLVP